MIMANDHKVPCMYLRQWGDDPEKGREAKVYRLMVNPKKDEFAYGTVESFGSQEGGFYTALKYGKKDNYIETGPGKLEGVASPIIEKIIKYESIDELAKEERERLCEFIAMQNVRGDAYRSHIKKESD